jgi:hypothetical protein
MAGAPPQGPGELFAAGPDAPGLAARLARMERAYESHVGRMRMANAAPKPVAYFAMGRYAEAHSMVTQAYALVAQGQQAEAPPVPATQASDGPAASGTAAASSERPSRRRVPTARAAAASAAAAAAKPATEPKPKVATAKPAASTAAAAAKSATEPKPKVAAAKPATMPGAIRKGFCIFGEGS